MINLLPSAPSNANISILPSLAVKIKSMAVFEESGVTLMEKEYSLPIMKFSQI